MFCVSFVVEAKHLWGHGVHERPEADAIPPILPCDPYL